jgi:hypothetical protein
MPEWADSGEKHLMQALRYWSLARVLLSAGAWFFVGVAGWLYFNVRGDFVEGEGAGVAAVSVTINPLMIAILIVPPIVLMLTWSIMTRSKSG